MIIKRSLQQINECMIDHVDCAKGKNNHEGFNTGDCNLPVRVLHVIAGMGSGGAESFIMNMYRNIDRSKVQFDFLLRSNENIFEDEIKSLGGSIYVTASFPKHAMKNYFQVWKILTKNNYQIIHVHGNALMYTSVLRIAKSCGVECRIMHSHSTSLNYKPLRLVHEMQKKMLHRYATDYYACSEAAGKWMFNRTFTIINNAIDTEKFSFSENGRRRIREELGLNREQLVVGHVGRFLPVKNHAFLIDVFCEILKQHDNAELILVGTGGDETSAHQKVERLGIQDHVRFLGVRKDVSDIMSAMDIFIFPSLYEGLPIVLVEAQSNGLPIICSDVITDEVMVTSGINKCALSDAPELWSKKAIEVAGKRYNESSNISSAGFDVRIEAGKLQGMYLNGIRC